MTAGKHMMRLRVRVAKRIGVCPGAVRAPTRRNLERILAYLVLCGDDVVPEPWHSFLEEPPYALLDVHDVAINALYVAVKAKAQVGGGKGGKQ